MIYIYTNGVLLSHRYIVDEHGTAITRNDVSSVTQKKYTITFDKSTGDYTRTLIDTKTLSVNDIIPATIQTDENGNSYNFRYCEESGFTLSNTVYLVVYQLTMTDGHTLIINAKAETRDA